MIDIRQALKTVALATAQREGWRGPTVRVTASRKTNKLSVHIRFSGDPGVVYDAERVLGRTFAELRARRTPEVQAQWPEIVVNTFIMLGATSTGATISFLDGFGPPTTLPDEGVGPTAADAASASPAQARLRQPPHRPVGSPPWMEP